MKPYTAPALTPMGTVEKLTLGAGNNGNGKGASGTIDPSGQYKPIVVNPYKP